MQTKRCFAQRDAVSPRGLGPLRLGSDWQTLLRRAGQPQQRMRAWSWCVKGSGNQRAADVAVLSAAGKVELVGSTARGRSARGVRIGARAKSLRGVRRAGPGLRVRISGRRAWVYAIRRGRVRAVAVATRSLARRPAALRTAVSRLRAAKATQAVRSFVPNEAQAEPRLTGRALAATSDPQLNAKLAMLCSLQAR